MLSTRRRPWTNKGEGHGQTVCICTVWWGFSLCENVWAESSSRLVPVSPQSAAADSISDNEAANNLFTLTTGHTDTSTGVTPRPHWHKHWCSTRRWLSSRHSWHNSFETWPDEEMYYTLSMYHCLPITPLSQVSPWYHHNCVSKVRRLDVSKYNQMDNWLVLAAGGCWCWLAHNDHICVTLAVATSPGNGHIYTATYCITFTGWHHK